MRTGSFKTKLLIGAVCICLFLGLTLIVFARTVLYDMLDEKLAKRGVSLAKNIAQASVNPLLTEKYFELEMTAKDYLASEGDIEYIFIVNSHGDVVAHTFEGGFPSDLRTVRSGNNGRHIAVSHLASEKGTINDIAVPLQEGRIGTVHLGMSGVSLKKDVNDIVRLMIGISVALTAAGVVLAFLLARSVARPLHLLAVAVQAMERGDLNVRVPVRSDDEIGHLAGAFNKMAAVRMQAENILAVSEKKLRDIAANLGEGLMVLNERGRLTFMNAEAERMLGWKEAELFDKKIHELTHYQKADSSPYPADECPSFKVLTTGEQATVDDDVFTRKDGTKLSVAYITAPISEQGKIVAAVIAFRDITKRKEIEADREQLILFYQDALNNVKTLSGLIPICSSCKKIRDDSGYWSQLESYIRDHSDADFSHGLCPACAKKLYPNFYKDET